MRRLGLVLLALWQRLGSGQTQRTDISAVVSTQTVNTETKKYGKLTCVSCIALIVSGFFLNRSCNRGQHSSSPSSTTINGGNRVEIKDQSGKLDSRTPRTIPNRTSSRSTPYTPSEGTITLEPVDPNVKDINDIIRIHRQVWGFTRELGIQTSFFQVSAGLDYKFFFVRRFGATVGILGSNQFSLFVSPTVAVTYKLDRLPAVHNLSLWVGFVPLSKYQYQAGLRLPL